MQTVHFLVCNLMRRNVREKPLEGVQQGVFRWSERASITLCYQIERILNRLGTDVEITVPFKFLVPCRDDIAFVFRLIVS